MNKKFLNSMFAFVLLLPCMLVFAACNPKDPSETKEPTVTAVTYEQALQKLDSADNFTATTSARLIEGTTSPKITTVGGVTTKVAGDNFYMNIPEQGEFYYIDGVCYVKDAGETSFDVAETGIEILREYLPSDLPNLKMSELTTYFQQLCEMFGDDVVSVNTGDNGTEITITLDVTTFGSDLLDSISVFAEMLIDDNNTIADVINTIVAGITGDKTFDIVTFVNSISGIITDAIGSVDETTTVSDLLTTLCGDNADVLAQVKGTLEQVYALISNLPIIYNEETDLTSYASFGYFTGLGVDFDTLLEMPINDLLVQLGIIEDTTADEVPADNAGSPDSGSTTESTSLADKIATYTGMITDILSLNYDDIIEMFTLMDMTDLANALTTAKGVLAQLSNVDFTNLAVVYKINFDANGNLSSLGYNANCALSAVVGGFTTEMNYTIETTMNLSNVATTTVALPTDATYDDVIILEAVDATAFVTAGYKLTLDRVYLTQDATFTVSGTTYATYNAETDEFALSQDTIDVITATGTYTLTFYNGEGVQINIVLIPSAPEVTA